MKHKKTYLFAFTALCMALLCYSCFHFKPKIRAVDPAFGKYITGYSSGMLSRKSNIRIELAKGYFELHPELSNKSSIFPYSPIMLPDSNLLKGIFSFEPKIKGRAVWVNDRVIEFIPEATLPVSTFYDVKFKLENLQEVPSDFEILNFQFSTFPQNLFVEIDGLSSKDDYFIEWQKLTGKLSTSDSEDTSAFRKLLKVTFNGKVMPISFETSYSNNGFYFYVDSIERQLKPGNVVVTWDGFPIGALQRGTETIEVPSLGDFHVTNAKVVDEADQFVELRFSDPINSIQDLNGIITISGLNDLTYAVDDNVVKVFLKNRMVGNKTLMVNTGIKNFKSYKMNEPYQTTLTFNEPMPAVRIKGNGVILPNSIGLIFPFESISLKAVDVRVIKIFENNVHQFLQVNDLGGSDGLTRVGKIVAEKKIDLNYKKGVNSAQWNQHVLDLGKLITPEPGAIYRVSIKFNKSYATCDCSNAEVEESSTEEHETLDEDRKFWNEDNWHSYGFDDYDEWYYYNNDYSPCNSDYYRGKAVSRNILASDIGLIYKLDDNKMSHAFVTNLITAKPLANVNLEYYDYAKQIIASGVSDANGMLDIQLKQKPFLLLAKHGKQRGYLKLLDGNVNSLSKFDVSGEVVQKGVKGFIYGERGVWRPGDSLFLTFIMEDKGHRLPPNHPVKFELQNPNGQVIYQTTKTKHLNGMYDFRTVTSSDAMTGNYTAIARVGNRTFSQNLKVETVKPNRLKIYLDFGKTAISDSVAKLQVKWLHGAVAKNLHALVNVSVNQTKTVFEGYKNFVFDSPIRSFNSDADVVFDGHLNEKGETKIKTNLNVGKTAPGMLKATYITKVFEEGGDFSIDRYFTPYSPFNTYVGLNVPDSKSYDHTYETGQSYQFNVVTLNASGKVSKTPKLQVKIYKIQWRWWYEKEDENLANYMARSGSLVVKDTIISAAQGKGFFNFKINYPDYGRFLITVTDLEGGHETGQIISMDWPYWNRSNRTSHENANMLSFSCDKESYAKGEFIKLSFPSPSDGMALVSVESGTKVTKKFWIPTKKGETTHQFQATGDMAPNAFIHVSLIQPHASTKNDLPIRMYGVVPVMVDDPETHLFPEIQMADVIKPESTTTIKVKEEHGKKMTYTIAMVDEGLLDLTRFKTPNPWPTFYAKEALGVKTWDMYDAVIGAYAGKIDKLLGVGGDGDGLGGKGVKATRFKPMVKFMGPFTLEAGAEKSHKISIPNYVGSVRVMVVAQNQGAYGNTQKAVAVRKPLMVLATMPRVLGPGETISLPVNIFAMENHVKDVKVEIQVNEFLTIDGASQQNVYFKEVGDEVINFKLRVIEKTGIAKVKIMASSGKEKAIQEIEVEVRAPNPKVTEGAEMVIEPGKSVDASIVFKGINGTNKATIEFSSIPSLGLEKRLDYLIQYPHGCIEQTTSSVFPQLFLLNVMDLSEAQKSKISNHVKMGLKRLQMFQTSNGGFSYWPGEFNESEWGSNYAGHFMLEAEKQGYALPLNVKNKWIKYQKEKANNWSMAFSSSNVSTESQANQNIQAYRLFVLALCNSAELGAMNRLREEKNVSVTAKWRLAAAYKLIGQHEVALTMVANLPIDVKLYKELSNSYGSNLRDEAMILETLSLLKEQGKSTLLAKKIAKTLSSATWLSTQETAYSLLAMCNYAGLNGNKTDMSFSYHLANGTEFSKVSKKCVSQVKFNESEISKSEKLTLINKGSSNLFVKVMVEGVPLIGDKTASAKDLKMLVVYKDMKGKTIEPDKIIQGTDFKAIVTISNPGTRGTLQEMALNQIFPSGWEIHNSRMDNSEIATVPRYQDIRDDRIYSYYDLSENTSKIFEVQLNATYLGRFYLPTVYSEAMYDHLINAKVPGRWVEVVKDIEPVTRK